MPTKINVGKHERLPTKINVGKHERHVGRLKMLRTGLGQRLRQPLLVNLARV